MGGAIFSVLVYVLIGVFVFRKVRQVKGRTERGTQGPAGREAGNGTPQGINRPRPQAAVPLQQSTVRKKTGNGVNAHMAREKINILGWEDRRNDWLARQMEEERISARKMSEMFQLKLEHRYNCEAEMLKQFHEAACNAGGVDTGEKK